MAISSYGAATDSSGVVRILKDLDINIEGRHVLVVEDIIDSGLTLSYLIRNLESREPASLEVAALMTKPARREIDVDVRWVGFEIPNRFVIGYGLDFAERYRNLPYVGVLSEESDPRRSLKGNRLRASGEDRVPATLATRSRESLLPQRAFPTRRDRAARLPGEPDADPAQGVREPKPTYSGVIDAGQAAPDDDQARRLQPEQARRSPSC